MQDAVNFFDTPMLGLERDQWLAKLEEIADDHGNFEQLGKRHFASFVEDTSKTLLVTFETIQSIQARKETGQPLGFELVQELGWSHLCLLSDGQTWFRDAKVYAYFDRLIDDGFFDEFDKVVFYGAGPCGYAASAFSVASPGATVIALQPQATLDPRLTAWDDRFTHMRGTSFTSRYGFAPDMVDAAKRAYVIYNPHLTQDAMHAAMFARPNVTLLRAPMIGPNLENGLYTMQILLRVIVKASQGKLTDQSFGRLLRARREYLPYLRALLGQTELRERPDLSKMVCANVTRRFNAPRFKRKLAELENETENDAADRIAS